MLATDQEPGRQCPYGDGLRATGTFTLELRIDATLMLALRDSDATDRRCCGTAMEGCEDCLWTPARPITFGDGLRRRGALTYAGAGTSPCTLSKGLMDRLRRGVVDTCNGVGHRPPGIGLADVARCDAFPTHLPIVGIGS
mmetsp:Transcript_40301/g.92678  ORF Transcript_40301/g.92678 Transcript_40301/m.92678 type:complete len:140 (+) Transcript_40301:77-496(+)|eukprot:2274478-Amphidinium_carterae.1